MNKIPITSKIYVWSVLMEPLLFFVIAGQSVTGVGGNISRLLQLFVVTSLILRAFIIPFDKLKIPNPFAEQYKWYSYYLIFIVISFIYGYFTGAYDLGFGLTSTRKDASGIFIFLNSQFARPFFEYFITIYYFIYFVILPRYLLDTSQGINYFFKVFLLTFYSCLLVGILDFLLIYLIGFEWVPRHLSDFTHVGKRFHGLAGEPRDAFVYLGFGIAIFYLRSVWLNKQNISNLFIVGLFICMLLTQSSSGFIGLIISAGLIFIYQLPKMPIKYLAPIFTILIIISLTTYFAVINSTRTMIYIDAIPAAIQALESSSNLPPIIQAQIVNVYPVWVRISELMRYELLPIFIGTGFGSASILNSIFFNIDGVYNPHANIIRVIFESGVIGLLIFINAFISPLKRLISKRNIRENITMYMLFILGLSFGHRSSTLFIFFGMLLLIFSVKNKKLFKSK